METSEMTLAPDSRRIIRPFSIAAFLLTLSGFVLSVAGFLLPYWWGIGDGENYGHFGLWIVSECWEGECEVRSATQIEGGKEFLFITTVFETIGTLLVSIALIMQIIYIPLRKALVRSISIYCLGGAALFFIFAVITFGVNYKILGRGNVHLGAAFYLTLIGGVVCGVSALITSKAVVDKARRHDDEE